MNQKVPFEKMPAHSRVWIYQSSRWLDEDECSILNSSLKKFIDKWNAHGKKLQADAALFHARFLVFTADELEVKASGCSIDDSVRWIKKIGEQLSLDFFDRIATLYYIGEKIHETPIHSFWAMRKAGIVDNNTLVFDNLVKTVDEFRKHWVTTFEKSWHNEMWK